MVNLVRPLKSPEEIAFGAFSPGRIGSRYHPGSAEPRDSTLIEWLQYSSILARYRGRRLSLLGPML